MTSRILEMRFEETPASLPAEAIERLEIPLVGVACVFEAIRFFR